MGMTRREMLGLGGLLATAAAMPAAVMGAAGPSPLHPISGVTLTRTLFESLKGASFQVTTGSTRQYLTLTAVEDLETAPAAATLAKNPPLNVTQAPQPDAYRVRFYGGTKLLRQGTYPFQNPRTGAFSVFIVPSGDGQMNYTAIFNHI